MNMGKRDVQRTPRHFPCVTPLHRRTNLSVSRFEGDGEGPGVRQMTKRESDESIDVAATIAALRAQAVARGAAMGLSAQSVLDDPLRQAADLAHISAHFPIMWRIPIVGRALALVQRAMRIGLRWYINPIVDQINDFNEATVTALNTLAARQEALAARIAALELHESGDASAQGTNGAAQGMRRP